MMKKYSYLTFVLLILSHVVVGQVPAPGPTQNRPIAIIHGFAHIGNGEVIENATITFREGKIEEVAAYEETKDLADYKVIDATGKHVYPGLILPMSDIGLTEINAVRATHDYKEVGGLKPNVRSAIAYNTDSELIPTLRFNGIQLIQVVPKGGRIPGTSSVMQLDAWNWEDALYSEDDGVHLNWPNLLRSAKKGSGEVGKQPNENYTKQKQEVLDLIADTKAYMEQDNPKTNLVLEAMVGVVTGEKRLYLRVNWAQDIIDAIQTMKTFEIPKVVLVGMRDILLVKELVKKSGYPVILDTVHRLPGSADEAVDLPYRMPALVHKEGILACISFLSHSGSNFSSARNLAFMAGTTAAYGLDREEALTMVTLNAAKILGIDDRTGSLEVGKDANVLISEGDLLDMRTNNLIYSFIQGREVELEALQQRLYEKFKAR